jgi:diguanylate cyclase (GGDEF)-like protein
MRPLGTATEAIHAVSRLLDAGLEAGGPDAVRAALVREACEFLGVPSAALVPVTAEGDAAAAGAPLVARSLLLLPLRDRDGVHHVLVLADDAEREFSADEIEVAAAFAGAAAASLAQLALASRLAERAAQRSALARAAQTLNESLDLGRVLARIGREAASILEADLAAVWRGNARDGVEVEAVYGFPPEVVGYRLEPGEGLAGQVAKLGESVVANDYAAVAPPDSPFLGVESALGVPMRWDGELHGVLAVGYTRPHQCDERALELLEAFADLASVACRNASAHAGLAHAARTDGLTGCLNHAAMHEALQREIERCRRSGHGLSFVLLDLDDFKQVNERHGHLVGDEVLRRVGHALQRTLRPYDHVARYGGDEFAILAVDAGEVEAEEIARRAIAFLNGVSGDFGGDWPLDPEAGCATAGVAEWDPTLGATDLIAQADRALLFGKQAGGHARVVVASALPESFHPGRFRRRAEHPATGAAPAGTPWPGAGRGQLDRLRKRSRQLALANALGTRLSGMTGAEEILDAAATELQRAFGYSLCAILRVREDGYLETVAARWAKLPPGEAHVHSQPRSAGIIGRCLRERQPVVVADVALDPDYLSSPETAQTRSELCVPLLVGDDLWGAVNVEEVEVDAFGEDDARLVEMIAGQVGSALQSAFRYEQLERAYLGTAGALAAALDAKDAYAPGHSGQVLERAEELGRRLGIAGEDLRALRYGAVFHDLGKIAVPEAILTKRGELTPEERAIIERHSVVGEQILAPVEYLAGARPLVRHEHERFDGRGYPDGLRGEEIPLGARIIFACSAYDAMTTDRPYRVALSDAAARDELRRHAGTQFDPNVVEALLALLEEAAAEPGLAGQPGSG